MSRIESFIVGVVLVALLGTPVHVHAAGKKTVGAVLTASGGAMMLLAFNYKGHQCPFGYSTHRFEGATTQCVFISSFPPFNSDVRDATTKATYERPGLMWGGLGVAATGIVLMMLPTRVAQVVDVDVSVTPTGWRASKTFGF